MLPSFEEMAIILQQNTQKQWTLDTSEHTGTSDTSYLGGLLSLNIGKFHTLHPVHCTLHKHHLLTSQNIAGYQRTLDESQFLDLF